MDKAIISDALAFIRDVFQNDHSGHDYFHTLRVYKMATRIAEEENADIKPNVHMNTAAVKKIAEQRESYMKSYISEFLDEWEGIR